MVTDLATGLKSPDYYNKLRQQGIKGAEDYLYSPEFAESSRKRRSSLAGKGVMSGTAYDRAMETTAGDIMRKGYRSGEDLATQAQLSDINWATQQQPFLEAGLTGQYGGSPTMQKQQQDFMQQWYPTQYTGLTPTGQQTLPYQQWKYGTEHMTPYQKSLVDATNNQEQLENLQSILNALGITGAFQGVGGAAGDLWGQLGDYFNQ